jgi:hypothetical protein
VANDQDGSFRLYDGTTLQQIAVIDLKDDADNVRYDAASRRFWVGYGEGGLAAIDPETAKQVADIKLGAHPESFQLETKGKRIFMNVPNAGYVGVVDRESEAVIEKIPLTEARANFPMALDEADHRLFIGCRSPVRSFWYWTRRPARRSQLSTSSATQTTSSTTLPTSGSTCPAARDVSL